MMFPNTMSTGGSSWTMPHQAQPQQRGGLWGGMPAWGGGAAQPGGFMQGLGGMVNQIRQDPRGFMTQMGQNAGNWAQNLAHTAPQNWGSAVLRGPAQSPGAMPWGGAPTMGTQGAASSPTPNPPAGTGVGMPAPAATAPMTMTTGGGNGVGMTAPAPAPMTMSAPQGGASAPWGSAMPAQPSTPPAFQSSLGHAGAPSLANRLTQG